MPDNIRILPILITMATVICLGGATLLFLRSRKSRSRFILSLIMLSWGLIYFVRVLGFLNGASNLNFTSTGVMDVMILVSGNLYLIFLLLYPLEIVRPGWLNPKRTILLLLPYVLISLFYYIVLILLGQKPRLLHNVNELIEHIGEFNVWYRFFMAFSIVIYLTLLFWLTWHYKKFYSQWCRNNYSNDENMDISWLRQYGLGVVMIGIAYFILLLKGTTSCLITHNITVQCFFSYTLYKGLFHYNPYTENFFSQTLDESDACSRTELIERQIFSGKDLSQPNEGTFIRKLPVYRDKVVEWMITNKPYLDPNFKLIDVMQILPLNRSYISRVFNEGFGCSFSDVVRDYRIREAERMLVSRMDIPVGQVGELCGFSSPSVFHRTFVQSHNGLTPNRYRKQAETK